MNIDLTKLSDTYFKISNHVKKSIKDPLNYKYKILDNGLKILYIEDTDTSSSAMALNIKIGSNHDYPDYLGIAHFLEHMLFMGSTKYPQENIFLKKVLSSGGMSNAFTSDTATCYFFNVPSFAFLEIADIFSSFLTDPLFNLSSVEREVNAVNSEHQKNLLNDSWKFLQILKLHVNTNHPFCKFTTGTLTTLLKNNTKEMQILLREALIKFYNTFYSSDLMTLFVYTNSISSVEGAIDNMFSKVSIKDHSSAPIFPNNIFKLEKKDNNLQIIEFNSCDDKYRTYVIWELHNSKNYDISLDILKSLFIKKSPGSLYDILLKKKYIYKISFGILVHYEKSCLLTLKIKLTKFGYINYLNVLAIIQDYINKIILFSKDTYKILYDEINVLNRIDFINYSKKQNIELLIELISTINNINISIPNIFIYRLYGPDFDTTYLNTLELLKSMTQPVIIKCKKSALELSNKSFKIEPYYQTAYNEFNVLTKELRFSQQLIMPLKNLYIPQNIKLINTVRNVTYPINITERYLDKSKLSSHKYYIDFKNEFLSLNSAVYLDIIFPTLFLNSDNFNKIDKFLGINLYLIGLKREFEYVFDDIMRAGYQVSIELVNDKIRIYIIGLTENFIDVCIKILEILFTFKTKNITKETFDFARQIFKNELINFKFKQPYQKTFDVLLNKLSQYYVSIDSLINAINNDSFVHDSIIDICNLCFGSAIVKCIFGGNINLKNEHISGFITYLNNHVGSYNEKYIKNINNSEKYIEIIVKNNNYEDKNIVLQYMVKLDTIIDEKVDDWDKKLCSSILLNNIASYLYFDELRTKSQLGYIVSVKLESINGDLNCKELYIMFIVQSSNSTLKNLIDKTTTFFNTLKEHIDEITDQTFDHLKTGLNDSLLQKYMNLNEKLLKYREIILTDSPLFNKNILLAKALKNIDKKYFIKYFNDRFFVNKQIIVVAIEN
jgi:insulysin